MEQTFKVIVKKDSKIVELVEITEANYKEGEVLLLGNLFYRALLGCGYSQKMVIDAMGKIAVDNGYTGGVA